MKIKFSLRVAALRFFAVSNNTQLSNVTSESERIVLIFYPLILLGDSLSSGLSCALAREENLVFLPKSLAFQKPTKIVSYFTIYYMILMY